MIQRPRNRQGRPQQQAIDGEGRAGGGNRARGGWGRGRGRGGRHDCSPSPTNVVPHIAQVVSGAHVSIVLKADQPTGRQVQGTVADVLTSGNHPRGIKVRLVDGRVGRVQRMATEAEARAGSDGPSNPGRNGDPDRGGQGVGTSARPATSRFAIRYSDVREEDEMGAPPAGYSLGDFLPPGHPLREEEEDVGEEMETPGPSSATQAVCPVCDRFEGDEMAVAHHVNSHFD